VSFHRGFPEAFSDTVAGRGVSTPCRRVSPGPYAYDEGARRLDVLFVSGLRYSYADVPEQVVEGLRTAVSKGRFFNANIRDRYAYRRRRKGIAERPASLGD
jgi:hypothetical protein